MNAEWYRKAACRGAPTQYFLPNDHPQANFSLGKRVCALCPVKDECLEDAMSYESDDARGGLRGGLVPDERTMLAKKRRRMSA